MADPGTIVGTVASVLLKLAASPGPKFGFFLTRPPNPYLRHCQDRLSEIKKALAQDPALVLTGTGGVGKTSLAVEYAHKNKNRYPGGAYWVNADLGFGQGYRELVQRMGASQGLAITEETRDDEVISSATNFLNLAPLKLVIFDDLQDWDSIEGCLPLENCHLLITTRQENPPLGALGIALPTEEQAQDIFLAYAGWDRESLSPEQAEVAATVCQRVERLPLALEIMGRTAQNTPPASFLKELDQVLQHRALTHTKEKQSILAALDLAQRRYGHERAVEGLKAVGYLHPEHIEEDLISSSLDTSPGEARAIMRSLAEMSVLGVGEEGYTVHRLIQEAGRELDEGKETGKTGVGSSGYSHQRCIPKRSFQGGLRPHSTPAARRLPRPRSNQ